MISTLLNRQALLIAAAMSLLAASAATAQDRKLVTWNGRVDKEAQITIRDTTIGTGIVGGKPVKYAYFDVQDRLPRVPGFVRVELDAGRGDVDVLQQPSASNDYAAIIRIRDKSAGADNYSLTAFWNPKRGEDRTSTAAEIVRETADAKGPNTMHWSGTIDREMRVEWSGMDVRSRNQSGVAAREVHSSVTNGLPSHDVNLVLRVHEGRGDVTIFQQPTEANGYTAIFKVRDPMSGRGHYNFDATWN
ncbi:MAG TPA: hypothetical protein VIJ16_10680 [Gemmatimonadaceae bacterium]